MTLQLGLSSFNTVLINSQIVFIRSCNAVSYVLNILGNNKSPVLIMFLCFQFLFLFFYCLLFYVYVFLWAMLPELNIYLCVYYLIQPTRRACSWSSRSRFISCVWWSTSRPKSTSTISSRTSSIPASTLSMLMRKFSLVSSQLLMRDRDPSAPSGTGSQRFTANEILSFNFSVSAVCWAMPAVLLRISATRGRHCSMSDDRS